MQCVRCSGRVRVLVAASCRAGAVRERIPSRPKELQALAAATERLPVVEGRYGSRLADDQRRFGPESWGSAPGYTT